MSGEAGVQGVYPVRGEKVGTALIGVLSGSADTRDIDRLVRVCHSLAIPYVRKRLTADRVLRSVLHLSPSDLAYDCVADLFAVTEDGKLPHFHAYFAAYPIESLSEEEILAHLRRLVFSRANHGIFRLYNEVDPNLGKILRNIKLALEHFKSLTIVERFGEPCLAPSEGDRLVDLNQFTTEELEINLRRYLHGSENIPVMLGKVALFLLEQFECSRVVSLMSVGIAFKNIYLMPMEGPEQSEAVPQGLDEAGLTMVIKEAVEKIRTKMVDRYSTMNRIEVSLLATYFSVIEERLVLTFSGDGHEKGLRELLRKRLDNLTEDEYRSTHKNRLEYLSRLTGKEVAGMLKKR